MTGKHTPGPWWRDEDGFVAAGYGDSYVTIASFDCSNDLDPDEREANKSLGIAAPDMLAALKAVSYWLTPDRFDRNGLVLDTKIPAGALQSVLDAIGKAGSVHAGCRAFATMDEARAHWLKTRGGTPLGSETMMILDFMDALDAQRGRASPNGGI